jgi:branched-chain amino acid transport system substrate-binding protein
MKAAMIGLTAALAMLATEAAAQGGNTSGKVKIGFVSTYTGPQAAIGADMKNSVELAVQHLGGKMGNLAIEVIFEDDGFKPEVGKQKSEKLIEADKVDFIAGFIWSNVLLASYKPIIDSQTFLISSNAGPSQIAGELCSPWFFSTSWQNDQTPMAMGEVLNKDGIKKLYVVAPNYPAGRDMVAGVKRTYKGLVVGEDMTKWPEQLDFAAELSKAKAAGANAIFTFFPGAHGVQFLTQYAQAGLKGQIPLYTVYTIDALSLPLQKELALDVPGTQSWVNDLPNDANKRYVADFKKKHGTYPSFYGAQSYDSIMLIDSAVRATGGNLKNKDAVRAALKKADFKSVRGPFKFGNNNFPIQNFYQQTVVKDAEGKLTLKTVAPILTDHQDAYAAKCPMK